MNTPLRDRIAFWLERWTIIHPLLLAYSHGGPKGLVYRNRINGHMIVKEAELAARDDQEPED